MKFLSISILVTFVTSSLQLSTPSSPTYTAAVIEYYFPAPADLVQVTNNLDEYRRIIREPAVKTADIIVFAESSLNNVENAVFLPDPKDLVVPCGNLSFNEVVYKISCAALDEGKYIVINLNEKTTCPDKQQVEWNDQRPCDATKVNIYNTNVVFDRKGTVIAKYRKYNLFGEKGTLKPYKAEMVTFTTDFNVTFGMFICFDLMFEHPPLDLVKKGVKDFIFSANWFSEIPFLTAVQIQQSWAYKYNVNLLAAGRNLPSVGSTGSGIYHGQFGPLTAIMSSQNQTKILVATVPKFINNTSATTPVAVPIVASTPEAMTNLRLKRDQIDKYITELIPIPKDLSATTTNMTFDEDICHNEFCCGFAINYTVLQTTPGSVSYGYRVAAYSGWRTFDGFADGAVQVCAVFACLDESLSSCGRVFGAGTQLEDKIEFTYIKMEVELNKSSKAHMMPNSLDTTLLPLNPTQFKYTEIWEIDNDETFTPTTRDSQKFITLELEKPHKDLLTFALYARDYNPKEQQKPIPAPAPGQANAITGPLFLTFLAVFCAYLIHN